MAVRQVKALKEKLSLHVLDIQSVERDELEQLVLSFSGKNGRQVRLTEQTAAGVLAWLSGWVDDGHQVNLHFNDVMLDASRPKSKRNDVHEVRLRNLMEEINDEVGLQIDPNVKACDFSEDTPEDDEHITHRLLVSSQNVHVDFTDSAAYLYVYKPVRQAFLSQHTRTPVVEEEVV